LEEAEDWNHPAITGAKGIPVVRDAVLPVQVASSGGAVEEAEAAAVTRMRHGQRRMKRMKDITSVVVARVSLAPVVAQECGMIPACWLGPG